VPDVVGDEPRAAQPHHQLVVEGRERVEHGRVRDQPGQRLQGGAGEAPQSHHLVDDDRDDARARAHGHEAERGRGGAARAVPEQHARVDDRRGHAADDRHAEHERVALAHRRDRQGAHGLDEIDDGQRGEDLAHAAHERQLSG
jgi:hypothetical protein